MKYIFNVVLSVVLATFFTCVCVHAQLDPSFGTGGKSVRPFAGHDSPIESFLLPDGKFLVLYANRATLTSLPTYHLARFNSDGTVDAGYGTGGSVQLPIAFMSQEEYARGISSAIRQADGKIVLVGHDNENGLMVRLNEDGSLDTSFSGDGFHRPNINQTGPDTLSRAFYQPDGKLVAVGTTRAQNGPPNIFIIRYETNGDLDFDFGNEGGFIVHPISVSVWTGLDRQSNGSYIALSRGEAIVPNAPVGKVFRFNTDGTLDNGFSSPLFDSSDGATLLVDSSDRAVVGGSPYYSPRDFLDRFHSDIKLTRLNANGGLDSSFGNGGTVLIDVATGMIDILGDVLELPDGSLAVAAITHVYKNRSAVVGTQMSALTVNPTGSVTGRHLATSLDLGEVKTLLRQPDGKLVITGSTGSSGLGMDIVITRHTGVPLFTYRFRGIPFEFSLSPSSGAFGISHAAVFRPSNTKWYAAPYLASGAQFGLASDAIAAGDYFGDFGFEAAVFRPSNGTWYISKGYSSSNFVTIPWGANGDIPAAYDYDGDGKYDVTVFRPSEGNWYIRQSSGGVQIHHWGITGDKPVTGDYDGDGLGDLAVWRPSTGVWYIHRSSDGGASIAAFGLDGDIPVQEDFDGDLKTDIAVFRPSTGVWYIWRSSDNGFTIIQFGTSGDAPVPADYDGDRKMDIAVYRPSTSQWYWIRSSGGMEQFTWGIAGDIAVQGRY